MVWCCPESTSDFMDVGSFDIVVPPPDGQSAAQSGTRPNTRALSGGAPAVQFLCYEGWSGLTRESEDSDCRVQAR